MVFSTMVFHQRSLFPCARVDGLYTVFKDAYLRECNKIGGFTEKLGARLVLELEGEQKRLKLSRVWIDVVYNTLKQNVVVSMDTLKMGSCILKLSVKCHCRTQGRPGIFPRPYLAIATKYAIITNKDVVEHREKNPLCTTPLN